MKLATYAIDQILTMPRPEGYLAELKACATTSDDKTLTVDVEGDCFQAMKAKYAGYQPTQEETQRAEQHKIEWSRKQAAMASEAAKNQPAPSRASRGQAPAGKGGCGGCKGRQVTNTASRPAGAPSTGCKDCGKTLVK